MRKLTVATRGSRLALAQTEWVVAALRAAHPELEFVIQVFRTQGDRSQESGVPLHLAGGKGLFTKELEDALLEGRADLAVHSLKDLPTDLPPGLTLGCVPVREEPLDAVVTRDGRPLAALPPGSRVGTSSLRRVAQLRRHRPDLQFVPVRGNVDTRLRKLDQGEVDALVMAAAGLRRAGFAERIGELLPPEVCLPAAGQGALAIEIRDGDAATGRVVAALHDPLTAAAVRAERAFLAEITGSGAPPRAAGPAGQAPPLTASCQVPVAAYARVEGGQIHLRGLVALPDGSQMAAWAGEGPADAPEALGRAVARTVLERGGREIIARIKG